MPSSFFHVRPFGCAFDADNVLESCTMTAVHSFEQTPLAAKGLSRFHPPCYLSDEWACPDREPIIGIPFYLADPKVAALEQAVNDIEDEREIDHDVPPS